jgi:hypothetical protein
MPGIAETMHEWKSGSLHSGSKTGPIVTSQKQAVAIALNQARDAGQRVPRPKNREIGRRLAGGR